MRTVMNSNKDFELLIAQIQKALRAEKLDGWLLYNFRGNNVFATRLLAPPPHLMFTRRYFYFIPKNGAPRKLSHGIEQYHLDHLPGQKSLYVSWQSLQAGIGKLLRGAKTIAMEYSPGCAIPYVSTVDAGTIELVKRHGKVKILSSANLIQRFEACWDDEQMEDNAETAEHLYAVAHEAFGFIRNSFREGKSISEYDVQQFMVSAFTKRGIHSDSDPNCSLNANAANPHYEPTKEIHTTLKEGDLVLLDLWAKKNKPRSVYADISWMGYIGDSVPREYEEAFQVIRGARDAAVDFLTTSFAKGKTVKGYHVDDVTRNHISKKKLGKYFIHRTGHSIGEEVHGNGANIDNLETHDERVIMPMSSFSIEPGIYFEKKWGMRTEIDVVITREMEVVVTGGKPQERIVPILA
jgi:Xaa-Pro dipeptidase